MQGAPYRKASKDALAFASGTHLFDENRGRGCSGIRQYITVETSLFLARMLQLIITMIITAFLIVIASKTVPLMGKLKAVNGTATKVLPVPILGSIVQGLAPAISETSIAAKDRGLLIAYALFQVLMVCLS